MWWWGYLLPRVSGRLCDPLYLTVNGVATYSHPDILGSTVALSNATASPVGGVAATFNYDPYGQPVVPVTSAFGYAGQRLEQTTGLVHDGARFYSRTERRLSAKQR
jgi:hypothetical protein